MRARVLRWIGRLMWRWGARVNIIGVRLYDRNGGVERDRERRKARNDA